MNTRVDFISQVLILILIFTLVLDFGLSFHPVFSKLVIGTCDDYKCALEEIAS